MEIQTVIFLPDTLQQTFMTSGAYLEIIESSAPISIQFYDRNGNAMVDDGIRNAEAGIYVDLEESGGWGVMLLTSAVPQTVRMLVGNGKGGSRRTAGAVTVSGDIGALSSAQRAKTGMSFATSIVGEPAAGQFLRLQMWNDAVNTRRAIVQGVSALAFELGFAAFVTRGNAIAGAPASFTGLSKLALPGTPNSVMGFAVYSFGTQASNGFAVAGFQPFENKRIFDGSSDPIVLPPGSSIIFVANTMDAKAAVTFEWFEENL